MSNEAKQRKRGSVPRNRKESPKENLERSIGQKNIMLELRIKLIMSFPWLIKAEAGWAVFTTDYYDLIGIKLDDEIKTKLYVLRKESHYFSTKTSWEENVNQYVLLSEEKRLYSIDTNGYFVLNNNCDDLEKRQRFYDTKLSKMVDDEIKKERQKHGKGKRPIIIPGTKELSMGLKEMGEKSPQRYDKRPPIRLNVLKENSKDVSEERLIGQNGEQIIHVIGALGQGKSTFKEVLVYLLCKDPQIRIAIVENGMPNVLNLTIELNKLGIKTVPIFSSMSEQKYYAEEFKNCLNADEIISSERLKLLSGSCPWLGQLETIEEREKALKGGYPCSRDREGCPYSDHCGRMARFREIDDAQVLIAMPEGILQSRMPAVADSDCPVIYEFFHDFADLIIVDEVDLIQRDFDDQLIIENNMDSVMRELSALQKEVEAKESKGSLSYREKQSLQTEDLEYDFRQSVNQLRTYLPVIELFAKRQPKLILAYQHAVVTPMTLKKNVLQKLEKGDPGSKEERNYLRFVSELEQYCNLYEHFALHQNRLGKYMEEISARLASHNVINHVLDIVDKIIDDFSLVRKKKTDKSRLCAELAFLLLLVQFDAKLKMANNLYRFVAELTRGQSGVIRGYSRFSQKFQQFNYEPMIGMLFGYKMSMTEKKIEIKIVRYEGIGRRLLENWPHAKEELGIEGPKLLCLSGTSVAPGSAHFDFSKKPDAVLTGGKAEGPIDLRFLPVFGRDGWLRISGQKPQMRANVIDQMLEGIYPEIENCLEQKETYRRVLIVTGSYDEAKQAAEKLRDLRHDWNVLNVVSDSESDSEQNLLRTESKSISRRELESCSKQAPDIVTVPLNIIARGYNILDDQGNSYFGTMFFLARPYMVPGSYSDYISMLHYRRNEILQRVKTEADFSQRVLNYRKESFLEFQSIRYMRYWRELTKEQRRAMTWFILVNIKQAIGRMQRNGNACCVYFCDTAFCDPFVQADRPFTGENSTVHSMEEMLEEDISSKDISSEAMKALYGNFLSALQKMNRTIEQRKERQNEEQGHF